MREAKGPKPDGQTPLHRLFAACVGKTVILALGCQAIADDAPGTTTHFATQQQWFYLVERHSTKYNDKNH